MTEPPSPLQVLFSRHTRRREFITLLGGAASWPLMVRAQPSMSTSERMTDPCQPAIDGTWKNFATDFRHTPDPTGVANSSPALDDWLTFARRQGSTPVKLYIPPGTYKLSGTNGFTNGVKDATISAWGVTVDNLGIGTFNVLPQDYNHSARIQTVNAGATSVTMISPPRVPFSVGQWIIITGLGLQAIASFPPNFQWNEFRQITAISGSTISFANPLQFTYKSTWPKIDPNRAHRMDVGGPATIYGLDNKWDCQCSMFGLRVSNPGATFFGGGRSITLCGMTFDGLGPAPSLAKSIVIRRCAIGQQNEIDKIVEYLEYDTCTGGQIFSQSSSINQLVVKNSTLTGLIGTVKDTILDNSSVGELILGPAFFGHGTRFRAKNNSKWTSARAASSGMDPNLLSFSNGTFAIANSQLANYPVNMIWAQAVPGHYFIAYYDGSIHGTPDGGPMVKFQILDVRQDATNTYIDTDLGSTLPRPTFLGGNPPTNYFLFPAETGGQSANSGPSDITQFFSATEAVADR